VDIEEHIRVLVFVLACKKKCFVRCRRRLKSTYGALLSIVMLVFLLLLLSVLLLAFLLLLTSLQYWRLYVIVAGIFTYYNVQ
jgi:hypothetical protein